jgi:hypothetical protein
MLRALGLPTDPGAYAREGIQRRRQIADTLFRSSPIAHRLRQAVAHIEPLPDPVIVKAPKELDEDEVLRLAMEAVRSAEAVPLTERMVPTSIADLAMPFELVLDFVQPRARIVAEATGKNLLQAEAEVAVGLLLEHKPSAPIRNVFSRRGAV